MGSSRDWAAKGTRLLGVKAVVTKSFERIHRSNLIGMGVLPLNFVDKADYDKVKDLADATFDITGIAGELKPMQTATLVATQADGTTPSRSRSRSASIPRPKSTTTTPAASCPTCSTRSWRNNVESGFATRWPNRNGWHTPPNRSGLQTRSPYSRHFRSHIPFPQLAQHLQLRPQDRGRRFSVRLRASAMGAGGESSASSSGACTVITGRLPGGRSAPGPDASSTTPVSRTTGAGPCRWPGVGARTGAAGRGTRSGSRKMRGKVRCQLRIPGGRVTVRHLPSRHSTTAPSPALQP